jgi:putative hemolysin
MATCGHLPEVGERIVCAHWQFEVRELEGRRIDKVVAHKLELPEGGGKAAAATDAR